MIERLVLYALAFLINLWRWDHDPEFRAYIEATAAEDEAIRRWKRAARAKR